MKVNQTESEKQPGHNLPQPNHRDDVDDEDENVKQLGDCSAVYLALQDCLVETNRNWKSCQPRRNHVSNCNPFLVHLTKGVFLHRSPSTQRMQQAKDELCREVKI